MRLSEIYIKEVMLKEFWKEVEADLIHEAEGSLTDLLTSSQSLIFDKFDVKSTDKVYSIVGSARLYLFPTLREAFGLEGSIGDLDMIFPRKEDWVKAGLEDNWNNGGVYRPTDDGSIEAFKIWDPRKAKIKGTDPKYVPRDSNLIVSESTLIDGYYFMSLEDIMAYKTALTRDKEKDIVELIEKYAKSGINNKKEFIIRIIKLIGVSKAREFLGMVKK